ncbi:MAG: hypothetical protein H0T62_05820 [Parachlamydiaceae bacterium]|nr:hypothetical protein [Parachlamydiaceae bacterium]
MKTSSALSPKTQILSLLLVIASAIFLAFAVAAIMVSYYESSKTYQLKNVLLSPQSTETLISKFIISAPFDYSEWDSNAKKWNQYEVNIPAYTEFFLLVAEDTSKEPVNDDILNSFNHTNPATLTLFLRNKSEPSAQIKEFQRIQFSKKNDYYRVELHMEAAEGHPNWLYFYHPSIDITAASLFTMESS